MDNFEVPTRYQQAKDQESASSVGCSRPEHSQRILEVLHISATLCAVLCRHTDNIVVNETSVMQFNRCFIAP